MGLVGLLSLWKKLDEVGKGEIRFYAGGGPAEKEEYVDFSEIEIEARKAIEVYIKTALNKVTKEQELEVCNAILKYLMLSFGNLERCTENVISSLLGIPRSRLRKLLALMEWNEVIQSVPIGKASPYILHNIGKALAEGYLRFSTSEGEKLTKIYQHLGPAIHYPDPTAVIISALQGTIPEPAFMKKCRNWMYRDRKTEKKEQIQRPFIPGAVTSFRVMPNDYLTVRQFLDAPGNMGFVTDVLLELGAPDDITEEQFMVASVKIIEKYLRLITKMMKPFHEVVKGGKPYLTSKASMKPKLLSGENVVTVMFDDLILDKRVYDLEHGLVNFQTEQPNESHVILAANILKAAIRLAKHADVEKHLIEEAEEMLKTFEATSQGGMNET